MYKEILDCLQYYSAGHNAGILYQFEDTHTHRDTETHTHTHTHTTHRERETERANMIMSLSLGAELFSTRERGYKHKTSI
jgi:hypothetical protein